MESTQSTVTERSAEPRTLLAAALLVALIVLAYLPGLRGGFAFDDYNSIVDNTALELRDLNPASLLDAALSRAGTGPLARPLAMLSFAANRTFTGLDPWPFKLTNLAIHALNALLVWALLRQLLPTLAPRIGVADRNSVAWLIAALWALHPINLTSVLYVVQRMTSLSATFVLLSLLVYIAGRQRATPGRARWPWGSALLAALALLCKETALSLVFYLAIVESTVPRAGRPAWSRGARLMLSTFAIALLAIGGWYVWQVVMPGYAGREFTLAERLWSEARVLFAYLHLMLVPLPDAFTLFHDDFALSRGALSPPTTLLSAAGLAALSALVWWRRAAQPYLVFGWAWFVLGHVLEGSVIPLELMHEHRNYLPGLGIITALTLAAADGLALTRLRAVRSLVAIVVLSVLAGVTVSRAALWANPREQTETELRHHPLSPRLWYEAGRLRIEQAGGDATRRAAGIAALTQAAELAPIKTLPLSALLKTAIENEERDTIARLLPIIVAQPRESVGEEIFRDLVICQGYGQCRRDTETVQALGDALLARVDLSAASRGRILEWLAVFYARILADPAAAITILDDLVRARPADAGLKTRLAEACASAGQTERAVALAREVRAGLSWRSVITQRDLRVRLARLLDGQDGI